ncbi:M56 family metallopeptidase [Flavobacterium sp.]|uniref:M56 family metallopeptidase n=1 Tax=Flavobacterium sp. TaxID=239 RepID=UPI004047FA9E
MENLMLYFIKANGLIILFYLMYVLFLRKETFFVSNRLYMILGLILSLILPLITFTKTIWVDPTPVPEFYQEITPENNNAIEIPIQENPLDWTLILSTVYVIISVVILLKIGIEIASFYNRIRKHNQQKEANFTLIHSNTSENPFSFFHYIVINPHLFSEAELQHIVTHESIHVKQKHSIDVLLGKLFCAVFWVNPIIWLYRKAMLQNLEFIADNETFKQIENKYEYQKTLLKVVTHQHDLSITNQFYQSLIKKRIVMLHTNQSHKRNAWKYATILPLLVGFMLLFQIKTVAQVKENSKVAAYAVEVDYSHIVTSKTTDAEIKEIETSFQDDEYNLKISNVKRNNEEEIIEIKLEFSSKENSKTKDIKIVKGDKPITPIRIYIKEDKNNTKSVGFEDVKDKFVYGKFVSDEENSTIQVEKVENEGWTVDNMIKDGKKINLIINGKLQIENEKIKIPLDQEIDVMKELNASDLKSKYKIDKKEGEVYYELTTKKELKINEDKNLRINEKTKNSSTSNKALTFDVSYKKTEQVDIINNIKNGDNVDAKKALIIFNDKEITYEELDKINPNEIASSSVMTATKYALNKYGEKAKNGVIVIESKDFFEKNNPDLMEKLKNNSAKPKSIELKSGDVVIVFEGDKIKFPGYPTQYLNQLKLEFQGKILEDNIDFFKNYELEKIKDIKIIEDDLSPKEKKRIKKIIIETK